MMVLAWLLAGVAVANGIGAILLCRWVRSGMTSYASFGTPDLRPQLIVPATGPLDNLEQLRAALDTQDGPPASIAFAVESRLDPAFARIRHVFPDSPVIVAGQATVGSQKTRNQAAAIRTLPPGDCMVLADADILPRPRWLAQLIQPIATDRADIVSGYRWPVPTDAGAATLIGTWIDRSIASLTKAAGSRLIWGGSIALSGAAAATIDLPTVLETAITDDLALGEAARAAGLRTLFRSAVLVPTPFAHDFRSLYAFGKRQYQLVRLYNPGFWGLACAITTLNLVGTTAILLLAVRTWAGVGAWAATVLLALIGSYQWRLQARAAEIRPTWGRPERLLPLLSFVLPVVHFCHLAMILGGSKLNRIEWGRHSYRLRGKKVVRIERRASA